MPKPLEVFNHPERFWDLLTAATDVELEDQFFDRKEACRPDEHGKIRSSHLSGLIDELTATISAFANENHDGGLLVLGISKTGELRGLGHLSENQRNSITGPNNWLVGQDARVKLADCTDGQGKPSKICLIYVPYAANAICETVGASPRAWRREGGHNALLTAQQRDQLRHDKLIVSFEQGQCCPFDQRDLDRGLLVEFRKVFHADARYEYSDEELLYQAGALTRDGDKYHFTNAGFLFFAANPQRVLDWASIRLLRYESLLSTSADPGLVSLDKYFTGSIPQQIRNIRVYLQESGFFKKYQVRNPSGGFTEQPEVPLVAVDEVIVNAVVHRDYAVKLPIECKKYFDSLSVNNPGRVLQREKEVPKDFSLADVSLDHAPRNPRLLGWLKLMRDERGAEFVRALSEGTRRMRDEMVEMGLPAPQFHVTPYQTRVTLYNNSAQREALLRPPTAARPTEFTNLFPLSLPLIELSATGDISAIKRLIASSLEPALRAQDWFIDDNGYGRIRAHKRGSELPVPNDAARIVRFYPAYLLQVRVYWQVFYLAIDYSLEVKNIRSVTDLLREMQKEELIGKTAFAEWRGWRKGRIRNIDGEWTEIELFDYETTETFRSEAVIPNLSIRALTNALRRHGVKFDLPRAIKQASLSLEPNASRVRAARTEAVAGELCRTLFPLSLPGGATVGLIPAGAVLSREGNEGPGLRLFSVSEPSVEFHHHHESSDIREGITKFGAYDTDQHDIELIPICLAESRNAMASLIERLKSRQVQVQGRGKNIQHPV
jgi:predicted HTH transcriptional regulator